MKKIKRILLQLLGRQAYLQYTSALFFIARSAGWLKNNPAYYAHYLTPQLIKPGFKVLDIGANLGYYTLPFAQQAGPDGKVWAVEPIPHYQKVLAKNIAGFRQVTLLPYALGEKEGTLQMGIPSEDKHRHGLMRVLTAAEAASVPEHFEVQVKNPAALFADFEQVDYIKCDIEGYEVPVIPAMRVLLEKWRPLLQIETEGDNKKLLMGLLEDMSFNTFYAGRNGLIPYPDASQHLPGDLIAIPAEKIPQFTRWLHHA